MLNVVPNVSKIFEILKGADLEEGTAFVPGAAVLVPEPCLAAEVLGEAARLQNAWSKISGGVEEGGFWLKDSGCPPL